MGGIEVILASLLCIVPLVLLVGGGLVLMLVKLGIIGSYWLKGDTVEDGGSYTLNQSKDAADGET